MGNKGACALMPSEVKPFTSISETTLVLQGSSSRYIPPPRPTDFPSHQLTDEAEQTCTGEDTGLLHGEPASIEATNHGPSAMVGVKESVQSNSQINSRGITPRVEERIAQLEHEVNEQKIESLERELERERDERRRLEFRKVIDYLTFVLIVIIVVINLLVSFVHSDTILYMMFNRRIIIDAYIQCICTCIAQSLYNVIENDGVNVHAGSSHVKEGVSHKKSVQPPQKFPVGWSEPAQPSLQPSVECTVQSLSATL